MMNVLFITLDQFRGDSLSCAGHPIVQTPHLDALAAQGVRLGAHYSQAAPCSPGRASLYTGMYQMNHRVVANGTPLDDRFDNIARIAGRAGYEPVLFGYTDQAIDPRLIANRDDPRLQSYEGVLAGFDCKLNLIAGHEPWIAWLRDNGYDVSDDDIAVLLSESERPAEFSASTFLTNHLLEWLDQQDGPWFAHASYLRPHSPYAAAGEFATMYAPEDVSMPISAAPDRHPFHDVLLTLASTAAPSDEAGIRHMRAQYYGMISEVDAQLGRVWQALKQRGMWENTLIIVTADHGEQLGDHGLKEKVGYWESSYHIVGIVRDPLSPEGHGTVVSEFTENVDIVPTVCDAIGMEIPLQCDGLPLTPFLKAEKPRWWRDAASWEFDWRGSLIPMGEFAWPWDRRLEKSNLVVRRSRDVAYVQFGDGSWLCFDLATDPTWRTAMHDSSVVLRNAQAMLQWRMQHADRTMTGVLVDSGLTGRLPPGVL